jgi:predicted transcriptional regulator
MKTPQPSNLELQVLSVLWEKGPLTTRQVLESMPDGKKRAYTTILSTMQQMEKKGLLSHDHDGNKYVYKPEVKKRQILKPLLQGLVSNLFGGRSSQAMQYLIRETEISDQELEEIRALIDDISKQKEEHCQ